MRVPLEQILSLLGNPGQYQVVILLLLCLNYFPLVFNHVIMAFFGLRPQHQCHSTAYLPGSQLSELSSVEDFDSREPYSVNVSGVMREVQGHYGTCNSSYVVPGYQNVSITCPDSDDSMMVYMKPQYQTSIVTEWDLVCSQAYLSALATTIYFCGVMAGGVIFGHLADKFGRKPVMLVTLLMPVLVGIAISFAPWYSIFVALRFVQGVLMQGLQTSTYVLAMELFLPHHRSYVGAVLEIFWGLGVMTVPLLAYLIPNWRHLQLVISLPSIIAVVYICIIPESLRWLILKRRVEGAESLIAKITKWNKLEFPQRAWDSLKLSVECSEGQQTKQFSCLDLMKTPQLRRRSLVLFYLWFAISTGYYGLTWQLTSLPGNKYLNFFIGGAVETLAYALVVPVTLRFGRKYPLLCYFVLASVFMTGAGVVPMVMGGAHTAMISSCLAIAGKFAMGGLFCMIFLYTSELYPTVMRNIGMGSCAFWTRVGGVIAPQIVVLNGVGTSSLPLILFGMLTLLGGFLTLLLPETLGSKLPDSVDDVETPGSQGNGVIDDIEELKTLNEKNVNM